MEKVVYVLGAGFSAPLGLPVMSDFLDKSKDMMATDKEKYGHFEALFERAKTVDGAAKYFSGDHFNIEELLSLLEMQEDLGGASLREELARYIRDVIRRYTPEFARHQGSWPANWPDVVFGPHPLANRYGPFVCCLLGVSLAGDFPEDTAYVARNRAPAAEYSVVSLNYDRVLESVAGVLSSQVGASDLLQFGRPAGSQQDRSKVLLAKLHGDVETGPIVAPTWSKGIPSSLAADWREAARVIGEATQLRFLGYSLPSGDAGVRYLLKTAIADGQRLKRIDVICTDQSGQVHSRYKEFIRFPHWHFSTGRVESYLGAVADAHSARLQESTPHVEYTNLESTHLQYMQQSSAG